jgi:hypothetical protein
VAGSGEHVDETSGSIKCWGKHGVGRGRIMKPLIM